MNNTEILVNEHQKLVFNKGLSLLSQYWFPQTSHMSKEEYMDEEIIFTEVVKDLKPSNMLVNFENFDIPISPELQVWLVEEHFSVYEANGIKRGALVASKYIFPQLSVLQTIEEHKFANIDWRVFETEEEAMTWIKISNQ